MVRSSSDSDEQFAETNRCVTQRKARETQIRRLSSTSIEAVLKARIVKAQREPVQAVTTARANIGRSREEHDGAALIESVVAFVAARALKASPDKWPGFTNDSLWSDFEGHKPDPKKPKEHLRWVMKAVHEAKDERGKDRANVYCGAFQAKFDEGAAPESLIEFVKSEGGIDKAYRNALAAKKRKIDVTAKVDAPSRSEATSDDDGEYDQASDEGENSADSEDELESDDTMFAKVVRHLNAIRRRRLVPILLGAPSTLLDRIVDRWVDAGEVNIRCTLTRQPDGWVAMTATKVWRRGSKP